MKTFRAIIVDDTEISRVTLRHDLVEYCPQVDVVGEADGVKTAIALIGSKKPDVVFLDIQMGDGTGFDLLTQLKEIDFQIIFTTALDSHGIKAIKFSALDYLLKPIDPDDLIKAQGRIVCIVENAAPLELKVLMSKRLRKSTQQIFTRAHKKTPHLLQQHRIH